MLSPKLVLISVAVVFTALGVKESLPLVTSHFTLLWTFFLLSFTPPYLYFTLHAIIISILASSGFHHYFPIHPTAPPPLLNEVNTIIVNGEAAATMAKQEEQEEEVTKEIDLGMTPKVMDSPKIPQEYLPPKEKHVVSARFSHRKHKSSLGGEKTLAPKPKRHETLENTWKAITEGRSIPLSKHMNKCDTWHNRGEPELGDGEISESFNFDLAVGRRRKEPSLSQDELNRRVEEFIHKFNQQMRLQRQQSLEKKILYS